MYEKPQLKKFGSFRELTRTGDFCSLAEGYPRLWEILTGHGICVDGTPDGGGGMS